MLLREMSMRSLFALILTTSIASAETTFEPLPTFCDLVRQRAVNLLYYRFQPDFALVAAKASAEGEPLFEAMLQHAWVIQPRETLKQQAEQIRDFSDLWYGKCVLQ